MNVIICSGGMDSVTLAHWLLRNDPDSSTYGDAVLVSFDYGQRHVRELYYAGRCAERLGVPWEVVDVSEVGKLLTGSALTEDAVAVPHGHYAEESMRATVVPNRNAIMLSIAWGIGVARKAQYVAAGMHAGDHPIYPDCRPEFIDSLNGTLRLATVGYRDGTMQLLAPFVKITKAEIASLGNTLGVPWDETWSCYEGGDVHCGQCGTCVERREAFQLAGVTDPTVYKETP